MQRPIPTVVDLFCGAGGLSLGFHAAGCRILAGADTDGVALRTFKRNFALLQPGETPCAPEGLDLASASPETDLLESGQRPDILVGGPPCQGFSRIGRAKLASLGGTDSGSDPRNSLVRKFIEFARSWQPRAVLMENVPEMLSLRGQNHADEAARELEASGYRVGHAVLNSVWYGVPQFRERLFVLGIRRDLGVEPGMPPATHEAELPSGYLHSRTTWTAELPFLETFRLPVPRADVAATATTVSGALDDLPFVDDHLEPETARPRGMYARPLNYRTVPHSGYAHLMRAWPGFPGRDHVQDQVFRRTPRDHETFRLMRHGDRYPEAHRIAVERLSRKIASMSPETVPAEGTPEHEALKKKFVPPYPAAIFRDKWRKLIPDQPSWTVPAHLSRDSYSHIHHDSEQARSISVREAARLQSFPDGFVFSGNMGDCYRQIGNAVPPLLAWAIACHVLELVGFGSRRVRWEEGDCGNTRKQFRSLAAGSLDIVDAEASTREQHEQ